MSRTAVIMWAWICPDLFMYFLPNFCVAEGDVIVGYWNATVTLLLYKSCLQCNSLYWYQFQILQHCANRHSGANFEIMIWSYTVFNERVNWKIQIDQLTKFTKRKLISGSYILQQYRATLTLWGRILGEVGGISKFTHFA